MEKLSLEELRVTSNPLAIFSLAIESLIKLQLKAF